MSSLSSVPLTPSCLMTMASGCIICLYFNTISLWLWLRVKRGTAVRRYSKLRSLLLLMLFLFYLFGFCITVLHVWFLRVTVAEMVSRDKRENLWVNHQASHSFVHFQLWTNIYIVLYIHFKSVYVCVRVVLVCLEGRVPEGLKEPRVHQDHLHLLTPQGEWKEKRGREWVNLRSWEKRLVVQNEADPPSPHLGSVQGFPGLSGNPGLPGRQGPSGNPGVPVSRGVNGVFSPTASFWHDAAGFLSVRRALREYLVSEETLWVTVLRSVSRRTYTHSNWEFADLGVFPFLFFFRVNLVWWDQKVLKVKG